VHLSEKNGKKPYIAVREEIRKVEGVSTRLPPKSKHSRRDVPFDDETIAVLAAHRMRQHDERMPWRTTIPNWNPDDLVFPSEVGTPLGANNVHILFKKALKPAYGLPKKKEEWRQHTRRSTPSAFTIYGIRPAASCCLAVPASPT
jgi:hypothetical protein